MFQNRQSGGVDFIDYSTMSMNDVVLLAKQNNRMAIEYIFHHYQGLIHGRIKKRGFFLQGGDYDDLFEEGRIGLYKAIRDFNADAIDEEKRENAFDIFSKVCIDRQLISAIKTSTRKKHTPLNEMISLDRTLKDNENLNMMDVFGGREDVQYSLHFDLLDPEEQVILKEAQIIHQNILDKYLSKKEKKILDLHREQKTYKEITDDLQCQNPKTVDNGMQRARRKIERIKQSQNLDD